MIARKQSVYIPLRTVTGIHSRVERSLERSKQESKNNFSEQPDERDSENKEQSTPDKNNGKLDLFV